MNQATMKSVSISRAKHNLSYSLWKWNYNHNQFLKDPKVPTIYQKHPFTLIASKRNNTTFALESTVELKKIPSLPLVGSLLTSYSGMLYRKTDWSNDREWQLGMREKFGDFYSYGFPGFGVGLHGTIYSVSDPCEYLKVIRHEGTYPSGLIGSFWPLKKASMERNSPLFQGSDGGFFGRSMAWKAPRTFLQTDLLSPQAAASYVPGVIRAAELASKGAPFHTNDLNRYLNLCSFDMFSSVLLGELSAVADPSTPANPENLKFIEAAALFLDYNTDMVLSLPETFAGKFLNVKTSHYKLFEEAFHTIFDIARNKIQVFKEKYHAGELDEMQRNSYLAHALRRQEEVKGKEEFRTITDEMIIDICTVLLSASVDTTTGILGWALVHLASCTNHQDKLYQEIQQHLVTQDSNCLTPDMFEKKSKMPFLNAFLRESHRVTPVFTNSILKEIESDIEIHGTIVPANSKIFFNQYAIQMDPTYMDSPDEFRPERWLPEAVAKRKGTPLELMDHPFLKDPFSQGARKCPGSRVAMNEVLCLLSQLVLDYEIKPPSECTTYKDYSYRFRGVLSPDLPKLEFIRRKM